MVQNLVSQGDMTTLVSEIAENIMDDFVPKLRHGIEMFLL